jgi:hypothetical protein
MRDSELIAALQSENSRLRNALIMIAKDRLSDRFKTSPDSDYPSRERLAQALLGIYQIADRALKDN